MTVGVFQVVRSKRPKSPVMVLRLLRSARLPPRLPCQPRAVASQQSPGQVFGALFLSMYSSALALALAIWSWWLPPV